jgi:hypothetical protein
MQLLPLRPQSAMMIWGLQPSAHGSSAVSSKWQQGSLPACNVAQPLQLQQQQLLLTTHG